MIRAGAFKSRPARPGCGEADDPPRLEIILAMETKNTPIPDAPFIFVSYSRKDSSFVLSEIKRLEEQDQGYKFWYDRKGLQPGQDWDDVIGKAIKACACFMVFVTEDSVVSPNVRDEIAKALQAGKPFIGVYWDDVKLPPCLQEPVRRKQTLERHSMRRLDFEYEEPLSKALSKYLKKSKDSGKTGPPPVEKVEGHKEAPAAPPPVASSDVLPKILFFSLILLGLLFFLFAVVAFVTPYVSSARRDDPLNSGLAGFLTGLFLTGIAFALEGGAFATHRIYLRRKND